MAILEKCTIFLKSTSAKGIPRIVKHKSVGFKVYWIICTLMVFGYGFYNVGSLLIKYFSFDNVMNIAELYLDVSKISKYPAITICDKTPLPSSKHAAETNLTFEAYLNTVEELFPPEMEIIRDDLLSVRGYFQSMTQQEVDLVSQDALSFVVDCRAIYYGLGKGMFKIPCGVHVAVEKHVIPRYLNCYQFSFTNDTTGLSPADAIIGIEVTLFLDRYNPWNRSALGHWSYVEQLESGIRAALHYPGKAYFTVADAVDAAPGTSTTISLIHRERNRLGHPYSDCTSSDMFGTNVSFNPQVLCVIHCLESDIQDTCECIPVSERPIVTGADDSNYSFCENIHLGADKVIANKQCIEITRLKSLESCHKEKCRSPCHESTWDRISHSAKWPNRNQLLSFLQSVTERGHFPYKINYSEIDNSLVQDFVENNFLQIRYSLDDNRFLSIDDRPEMTSVDLFSALGGALNLWTGITVFFVIEIVELMLNICYLFRPQDSHVVAPTTHDSEDNEPKGRVIAVKEFKDN